MDQFTATGDDGKQYVVVVYREFIHTAMLDNSVQTAPGLWMHKLANGSHVNKHSEHDFEIVATGVKLRKQ